MTAAGSLPPHRRSRPGLQARGLGRISGVRVGFTGGIVVLDIGRGRTDNVTGVTCWAGWEFPVLPGEGDIGQRGNSDCRAQGRRHHHGNLNSFRALKLIPTIAREVPGVRSVSCQAGMGTDWYW
ncbi:MAG: hypothetical protein ACYC4U_11510 [Pirellulaceae bacterium]